MRHTCSTCGYCKSGALLSKVSNGREDPCETCEVITVNEFTNWRPIPITNADRIRSMTDEELAIWLSKWADCGECPIDGEHPRCAVSDETCACQWHEWLKSPADEVSE